MLETGNAWPPDLDCEPLAAGRLPPPAALWREAGFFNPIHPSHLSVCGSAAVGWAAGRAHEEIQAALAESELVLLDPVAAACEGLRAAAADRGWRCLQSAHVAVAVLREGGLTAGGPNGYWHGVLLQVLGLGLLIEGGPASGKSELALELVARGHRLVADDAVALWRLAPDLLIGSCPEPLFGFLHSRQLGVVDLSAQVAKRARVDLLVTIEAARSSFISAPEMLEGQRSPIDIAGGPLPQLHLAVDAAPSLALRIEMACRQQWRASAGSPASALLSMRQAALIQRRRPVAEPS